MAPGSQRHLWRFEQKEKRLMKRLLATALAATLMCGTVALAQTDPQAGMQPAAAPPPAGAQPAGATDAQAGAQPAGVTDTQSGNTTVVSNLPGGQPPSE